MHKLVVKVVSGLGGRLVQEEYWLSMV
jgi:hypothetical protein